MSNVCEHAGCSFPPVPKLTVCGVEIHVCSLHKDVHYSQVSKERRTSLRAAGKELRKRR